MKPYEPNLNRNNNEGWNIKKFLIALVFILIGAIVITYINYSVENKEGTATVQEIRNIFPTLSQESAEKFVRKANDRELTDEEFLTWADELATKGEVFLSDSQKEEMASFSRATRFYPKRGYKDAFRATNNARRKWTCLCLYRTWF